MAELKQQFEAADLTQKKEPKDLPRTKNVTGPAVYYPPGHEMFAKKEESGAWRAEVSTSVSFKNCNSDDFCFRALWRVRRGNTNTKLKRRVNQKVVPALQSYRCACLCVAAFRVLYFNSLMTI